MSHEPPMLLKDGEAAALLGMSRATLWRRSKFGELPKPIKIAGQTRWRREELVAAIERAAAQREGSTAFAQTAA